MGSYAALEMEADSGESRAPEASTTAGPLSPPPLSPDTRETEARCGWALCTSIAFCAHS